MDSRPQLGGKPIFLIRIIHQNSHQLIELSNLSLHTTQSNHPDVLYHAAHAHLQHLVLGGADGATGQLAALNLGVVLLHFGRAEEALVSYLEPGVAGILQPIVHYLRARAHQSLGKRRAARADLQAAARFQPSVLEPLNLPVSILSAEALAHPLK